jgi:hypothetical protein
VVGFVDWEEYCAGLHYEYSWGESPKKFSRSEGVDEEENIYHMGGTKYLFTHFHAMPGVNTDTSQSGAPRKLRVS